MAKMSEPIKGYVIYLNDVQCEQMVCNMWLKQPKLLSLVASSLAEVLWECTKRDSILGNIGFIYL